MQRPRFGKSECLTFFDSGANTHLIEKSLATNENLQRLSECQAELGVIGVGHSQQSRVVSESTLALDRMESTTRSEQLGWIV